VPRSLKDQFVFIRVHLWPVLFLLPLLAHAAILPDTIGDWKKGEASGGNPAQVGGDAKVWQEYGLQDSEDTQYWAGTSHFFISAYRFQDATGALAAFDQSRPVDAKPVSLTSGIAAANANEENITVGNYLFIFNNYHPKPEELNHLIWTAPKYNQSPLPTLPRYMPAGAEPNSERYIVGPESLAKFAPQISPSTAAFHFNAEAELARYGGPNKQTTLVIFNYPTMEMARDRLPHFQQIPGAVVKRSGPLVAVALNPSSPDEAERLLSRVKYQAEVTQSEHVPTTKDNPVNLFWNIIILCGILAGVCLLGGLMVGGLRLLLQRGGASGDGDDMITLHISGPRSL
jgi:hypothetical protein